MICIECKEDVIKVRSKRRRRGVYIYLDGLNRRWKGRHCPDCGSNNSKVIDLEPVKRNCRICHKPLPPTRYFKHAKCEINSMDGVLFDTVYI